MNVEETVNLAARGRGLGPGPVVVPEPSEFQKVAGGGPGQTRMAGALSGRRPRPPELRSS
jgi:hypothetical protein